VLRQVIEGLNLYSATYVLSWVGTAQGKIGSGSYGASGVTGAITGGTNTTIEFGPGTVSKVQLELGTVPTPFENRPYGVELALCQRYYVFLGNVGYTTFADAAVRFSACQYILPVAMRAAPTMGNTSFSYNNSSTGGVSAVNQCLFQLGCNSGGVTGQVAITSNNTYASARL
jgi:hypothetical protein